MRISDWSSDVCSSDLGEGARLALVAVLRHPLVEQRDEGGGERALGEQAAEDIGQLASELPGIGNAAGAADAAEQHVARDAENAADHREASARSHASYEAAHVRCSRATTRRLDRSSVVERQRVSVRVDPDDCK